MIGQKFIQFPPESWASIADLSHDQMNRMLVRAIEIEKDLKTQR